MHFNQFYKCELGKILLFKKFQCILKLVDKTINNIIFKKVGMKNFILILIIIQNQILFKLQPNDEF